jgi:TolA-binding protein
MPSISSPSITSPSSPVIKKNESSQTPVKEETKTTSPTETGLSKTLTASSLSSINSLISGGSLSSLLENEATTDSMSSLLSISNLITGKTDINSLLKQNTTSSALSLTESTPSSILLNQIVKQLSSLNEELELIKKENSQLSQQISDNEGKQTIPQEVNTGRLLRFSVNGYSVLDTCKTIYFSTPDEDGSFLCTADREYYADGVTRKETFYMLFTRTGKNSYDAAVSVIQDYLNEFSFVYQLSQKKSISAQRTGNLVSIIIDEPVWKLDLLITL